METGKRSLAKEITWRVVATLSSIHPSKEGQWDEILRLAREKRHSMEADDRIGDWIDGLTMPACLSKAEQEKRRRQNEDASCDNGAAEFTACGGRG